MKLHEPISILFALLALYWVVTDVTKEEPVKQCEKSIEIKGDATYRDWDSEYCDVFKKS